MTDQTLAEQADFLARGAELVNSVGLVTYWSGRTIEQEGTELAITYSADGALIKLPMREATDYTPTGRTLDDRARAMIAAAAGHYRQVCQLSAVAMQKKAAHDESERAAARFSESVHKSLLFFFDDHLDGQGDEVESAFDALLADLGLPGRTREYQVTARVTYEVTATITATSEDAAREAFEEDSHNLIPDNIDTSYWEECDIDEVEEA